MDTKRYTAPWYTLRYGEEHLYSKGRYKTKILPSDLPSWYLEVDSGRGNRYYLDVKHLRRVYYKGNYTFDHYFKDDCVFLCWTRSSDEWDTPKTYDGFNALLQNSDLVIGGNSILTIVKRVGEMNPAFDMSPIVSEIHRKLRWLRTYGSGIISQSYEDNVAAIVEKIGRDPREFEYCTLNLIRYADLNPLPDDPKDDFGRFYVVPVIERVGTVQ